MTYSQTLAQHIRDFFAGKGVAFEEKRMMGGTCFMVDGKMCVGVTKDRLLARIDPAAREEALKQPGCKPMDFTGRVMKGFVVIERRVLDCAPQLATWLNLALAFNPKAKASPKRKKSLKSKISQ